MRLPPQQARGQGFTLIELMVVLVIIGIVSAVMIPEMTGTYQDALLRSSGRELINVFNVASSRAASVSQLHRLRFDPSTGRYAVESQVNESAQEFAPLRNVPGSEGAVDSRISVRITKPGEEKDETADQEAVADPADTAETIRFFPDGTADARMILLEDRSGFQLAFRINPVTGRVHMMEVEPK